VGDLGEKTRNSFYFRVAAMQLALWLACATKAAVTFSIIVDTTTAAPGHGVFNGFGGVPPSISGNTMAFYGTYAGGSGIYTGTVGVTGASKIVDSSDVAPGQGTFTDFFNNPSINNGKVAFYGAYTSLHGSGFSGIYTGVAGTAGATKILDGTDIAPGRGQFTGFNQPVINGDDIAFRGLFSGGFGIYTTSVAATAAVKVVDSEDNAPGHGPYTSLYTQPVVWNHRVAFAGLYSGGGGVYAGTIGVSGANKIVETGDLGAVAGTFQSFSYSPAIRGDRVSFVASDVSGPGVYTTAISGGAIANIAHKGDIATGDGTFTSIQNYAPMNESGLIFDTFSSNNRNGIYLASGGNITSIIRTGDNLFGSKLSQYALAPTGFDENYVSFYYALTNGRKGIAVATLDLPEPVCGILTLLWLVVTGARRSCYARRNATGWKSR
jgi:hypothetical protein